MVRNLPNASTLFASVIATCLWLQMSAHAQPLVNPYPFTLGGDVVLENNLVVGPWDSTELGRITIKDGHFVRPDGSPFRIVGCMFQWSGCFPDSASAIAIAARLRALGINTVRFAGFDYAPYFPISIFADAPTTTGGGLGIPQMQRLDWFIHQLRQQGIRYAFTFQHSWMPRPGDGVRQPDSVGWGARMMVIFDPTIQRIHRDVIRLLLTHENPYTGFAYKDDPALLFVMPLEDSPLTAYWLYTNEIVEANPSYNGTVGRTFFALMDSLYYAFLADRGLDNDAALRSAWTVTASNTTDQIRNGGFEDPFDPSWTLNVNTNDGAQAILQYTETDKVSGTQCARVRIGRTGNTSNVGNISLFQTLSSMQRLHRYRLSLNMRTSAAKGMRDVRILIHNSGYPYNSYGMDQTYTLSSAWKAYTYDFTASSLDAGAAMMQILMGMDTGDVYIDDVSFREINSDGLFPGESIANATLQRDRVLDTRVTPARMKANADFYRHQLTNLLEADRKLIRDTLGSATLLVPSSRLFSRLDQECGMNYDFFASTETRNSPESMLAEMYGGTVQTHAMNKYENKPLVLMNASIAYPRYYLHEAGIVLPVYASLQNWDGIFVGVFSESESVVGKEKVDSNSYWVINDKPNVLVQLPAMSNMFRRNDIATTSKVVRIAQNREAIDYPPFHVQMPYSLSVYTDSRLPLFRRVETIREFQPEESLTPHREVSALSATPVDPSALNGENDQIFFDATKGILRVLSPSYICVAGALQGQLVNEADIVVEQIGQGANTSVVLSSLTDKPIASSGSSLLIIGSRGANAGSSWAGKDELREWGSGPFQLEGRNIRITLRAPGWDSCRVIPLGSDGKPAQRGTSYAPSATGRFNLMVNTAEYKSPWYRVELFNVPTSVDNEAGSDIIVAPSVTANDIMVRGNGVTSVQVFNMFGNVVAHEQGETDRISLANCASGRYTVVVAARGKEYRRSIVVVR